jgi:hypothetical protein
MECKRARKSLVKEVYSGWKVTLRTEEEIILISRYSRTRLTYNIKKRVVQIEDLDKALEPLERSFVKARWAEWFVDAFLKFHAKGVETFEGWR